MSTATRVGPAWALVETRNTYDPLRGGQSIFVYEGDSSSGGIPAVIAGLYPYQRYEIDNSQAPILRLTVFTPDTADAPVFELLANYKEKDLAEHVKFRYPNISTADFAKIQTWLRKPTDTFPSVTGAAAVFCALERDGVKKYGVEDYVLRYTVTATNALQLNLAYNYLDCIFTTAQLENPSTSGIILPSGITASIGNIAVPDVAPDYLWGWLKRAPQARQTTFGKVVISQEWWLQAWNTYIYDIIA